MIFDPNWDCFGLQHVSRHEGDLVAKFYFAKHKLVWEILDGSLKNKIEIQWSDIIALKANWPSDGPGTLDIVVFYISLMLSVVFSASSSHPLMLQTFSVFITVIGIRLL